MENHGQLLVAKADSRTFSLFIFALTRSNEIYMDTNWLANELLAQELTRSNELSAYKAMVFFTSLASLAQ